jgi:hypothetical protein
MTAERAFRIDILRVRGPSSGSSPRLSRGNLAMFRSRGAATRTALSYALARYTSTTMNSVHAFPSSDFSPRHVKCCSEMFV